MLATNTVEYTEINSRRLGCGCLFAYETKCSQERSDYLSHAKDIGYEFLHMAQFIGV